MGRILNTQRYPIKQNPSLADYVIGTDSEQNGKTVNFPLSAFGGENGGLQNNRFKLIKLGIANSIQEVVELINNITPAITVLADEIPIFSTIKPPQNLGDPSQAINYGLSEIGKGIYGVGGDTVVTSTNPFIIEKSLFTLGFNPDDIINSVVIDLGEVADGDFVAAINESLDTYVIEAGTNWFFEGTVGGVRTLYGWQGSNGTYGNGGTTAVSSDLFLIISESDIPTSEPSGFEKIDEGSGIGLRIIGRNPDNHGVIGDGAIDGTFSDIAGDFGATGPLSIAFGQRTTASGYYSFVHGFNNQASGVFTTVFGYDNSSNGYASFMQGYSNTEVGQGFSFTGGQNNNNGTSAGFMSGVDLISTAGVGTAILGTANQEVIGFNNGTAETQPMIIIGCGTHTTPSGSPWTAVKRENLLVGLRNGEFTLPITTISTIDAEATGRQVVTREWVEAQGFGGLSFVATLILNADGNARYNRDENNYGDVGIDAMDFSFSTSPSSTRGATGLRSVAFGLNTIASASNSMAVNSGTQAIGTNAFACGTLTLAGGSGSFAAGNSTTANGFRATAFGDLSNASGDKSFVAGDNNNASSFLETVFGSYATNYTPISESVFNSSDRIFTIGIGTNLANRADGFTMLKNGRIGIGIDNFESDIRQEKLIVDGSVRLQELILTNLPVFADEAAAGVGGLATDTVYKTATGELRIKL